MRIRLVASLLILFLAMLPFPETVRATDPGWEPVAPGIDYKEFHQPDPNNVFVARMSRDASNSNNLTIESSIAQGRLSDGLETVKGMAQRYDEAINFWQNSSQYPFGGSRSKIVVAINGYFYDANTALPYQGQIISGWYAKRFDDNQTGTAGSGFAWQLDGHAFIGECVKHLSSKQLITFGDVITHTMTFDNINVPRQPGQLIIYTPQYGARTPESDSGVEVVVELSRPMLVIPQNSRVTGTVREIRENQGSTPIPYDSIVLSAEGDNAANLIAHLQGVSTIGISQEISRCNNTYDKVDWTNTYASVGGSFYFLKDGTINSFSEEGQATVRNPRTAIAYNDQYIYFIVVDGRDPYSSIGMTIGQLGAFAKYTLDATWGIAQDGGGSSTMVVNGEVKNNTFCNIVFCKQKIFIPIVRSAPGGTGGTTPALNAPDITTAPSEKLTRQVANGMMMAVVEPITSSIKLAAGDIVSTTTTTEVHLGPGTNYPELGSVPPGTEGLVVHDANNLDGVLAKGSYWWKVRFSSFEGWVDEQLLKLAATPTPPPTFEIN